MLSQTPAQIISKATEIILQSRVDIKKSLLLHFQNYLQEVRAQKPSKQKISILDFLTELLPKDYYSIKQKYAIKHHAIKPNQTLRVQVIFYLIERTSGNRNEAECWTVQVCRKKEVGNSSLEMVVEFFREIIFILNKLPLFSIYQKDKQLKMKYLQDYKILFENFKVHTLVDLRGKDIIMRENEALRISAEISYLPSFKGLAEKENIIEESKRKVSIATSQYDGDRKVSVYAFYDPDLDFTFLSSDDEDFNKKGNSESIEIRMEMDEAELSEEFELLIANEDEDFLNENKEILEMFIKKEKQYLNL